MFIREHIVYPEVHYNDNERLNSNKDIQLHKNLSFPPISQDNQKLNIHGVR